MKFPWQKPDRKDQLIETYRQALAAYLALQALQQTEYNPAKKLTKED